eukprot:GHVL01042363.1.p1 GENE.GHVL01042363.1~~GHVL01042363.1.p1  ORF type:complete len:465 (+),score=110.76 GHVL01042363.1:50-1444(+)
MDDLNSQTFWYKFLQRPEAQEAIKSDQEGMVKELSTAMEHDMCEKRRELSAQISECSSEFKKMIHPIIKYGMVQKILYSTLQSCKDENINFCDKISNSQSLFNQMSQLRNIYDASPNDILDIEKKWEKIIENANNDEQQPWIPQISKGKRKLDAYMLKDHLQLGEQMNADGRDAYTKNDWESALLKYTQAVRLFEWVEASNKNDQMYLDEVYLRALKNRAAAALKLNKWQEAIESTTEALRVDDMDMKALYRRGKALSCLGKTKQAKEDFKKIIKHPLPDWTCKNAAKEALNNIDIIESNDKSKTRRMMTDGFKSEIFSTGRPTSSGGSSTSTIAPLEDDSTPVSSSRTNSPTIPESKRILSKEDVLRLLTDLKSAYQTNEMTERLYQIRRDADFEEQRILRRLRKVLPEIQTPILRNFGFDDENHNTNRMNMEKAVSQWYMEPQVKQLSKEIMQTIHGDLYDE